MVGFEDYRIITPLLKLLKQLNVLNYSCRPVDDGKPWNVRFETADDVPTILGMEILINERPDTI